MTTLFDPIRVGNLTLPNRIIMAPLTRSRAAGDTVPTDLMATYYAQRASAGLIISEATQVTPQGQGYPNTPGIFNDAQTTAWRKITDAVHAQGGRIFLQLWHVGRISHPDFQPGGAAPVAPSAIQPQGQLYTSKGMVSYAMPRALETDEIPGVVAQYAQGAAQAKIAGFDGVEIHAANGYLIDQFLRDGSNRRTDQYGGSIENRARFLFEVTQAVIDVWGANRVGARLSPLGTFNDMKDSDPAATFGYTAQGLGKMGIAYLHTVETATLGAPADGDAPTVTPILRHAFQGPLMVNGGYTRDTGSAVIASGAADMVSYGELFIANPDLPERFRLNAPLNPPDKPTFYGGDAHGYTDYPSLERAA